MADHWCQEHQQPWFKKGNMRGYAHPIKDEAGETTGWCNEDKPIHTVEQVAKDMAGSSKPSQQKEMSKDDWAEKGRITRKSIERQVALKEAVALAAIKGLDDAQRVVATAKVFEAYLEGNYLGEEAKRLIKKGEE